MRTGDMVCRNDGYHMPERSIEEPEENIECEHYCSICGEPIEAGDKYVIPYVSGEEVCMNCLKEMTVQEICEAFGEELLTA